MLDLFFLFLHQICTHNFIEMCFKGLIHIHTDKHTHQNFKNHYLNKKALIVRTTRFIDTGQFF